MVKFCRRGLASSKKKLSKLLKVANRIQKKMSNHEISYFNNKAVSSGRFLKFLLNFISLLLDGFQYYLQL